MLWRGEKLSAGPAPLWFQIAERLRAAVLAGEFRPGDRLPSEADLNREFGVSRTTARAALDRLENDGLIVRKSGKGSIVVPKRVDQPLKALGGFGDDMRARGLLPSYQTLSIRMRPADREVATAMKVPPRSELLAIERILCADAAPIAVSKVWLSSSVLSGRETPTMEDLNASSLYAWLSRRLGVRLAGGQEFIEADIADKATARRLGVALGAAILVARRAMQDGSGAVVEYSVMRYRADRYRYRVELGASQAS